MAPPDLQAPSPGLLVHEWISRAGGSERVLDSFSRLYPHADIFCLWNDAPDRYPDVRVTESLLARTPLRGRKALALPAMPFIWTAVKDAGYEWVLSSSHAFSHQVASAQSLRHARHYTYVHTPARYLWTPELDGRGTSTAARLASAPLRRLDRLRAGPLKNVAANSDFIRRRIADVWGVDARVIHPPVEVTRLQQIADWSAQLDGPETDLYESLPETFLLGASRFIPYKRLELVIRTGEATGLPVVLAGSGPSRAQLVEIAEGATVPVHFVDAPSDALLRALMAKAAVYVFPPVEDFGIMPVEAMALGTPVIVGPVGGAVESVVDGVTGSVLDGESPSQLRAAVGAALAVDADACRDQARRFGSEAFATTISDWMTHA